MQRGIDGLQNSSQNVVTKLNITTNQFREFELLVAGDCEFQMKDQVNYFVVNLNYKTCDCQMWAHSMYTTAKD